MLSLLRDLGDVICPQRSILREERRCLVPKLQLQYITAVEGNQNHPHFFPCWPFFFFFRLFSYFESGFKLLIKIKIFCKGDIF